MDNAIYQRLVETAKQGGTVSYSQIAPLAGLDMSNPADRTRMGDILDEISRYEHSKGRPLLSAVVIRANLGQPGQGFYSLANELGLYDGRTRELEFFVSELNRVHDYWRNS